jgi:glyoxylase-like metal-dependent hydrolase (beta-lactamase superfamily II)
VDDLKRLMKDDGFDPNRIKVVISTHAHPDHFEGAAAFRGPTVKIGLSWQERKFVDAIVPAFSHQLGLTPPPDARVDFYLREGSLELGKFEFQVLLTPGHSPGSICLYWPRHRILVSGDVVFLESVGRTDLPGGHGPTLKTSLERLSRLPVDLLIPGHGPAIQGADRVKDNFAFIKRMFFNTL